MRLSSLERDALITALKPFVFGSAQLYLFGSRLDDQARGGDIDLALVGPAAVTATILAQKHRVLAAFEKHLGERKIDLAVLTVDQATHDAFWQKVLPGAALLWSATD